MRVPAGRQYSEEIKILLAGRVYGERARLIWMLCNSPSAIAVLTSDAPPWVMKGNGMPVTGISPATMPALTSIWKMIIAATPPAKATPKTLSDSPADQQHPPDQADEEQEHDHPAQEAELLEQHGKRKVGRLNGQQVGRRLAAVGQSLAEDAAGADRDLRLSDLEAGALRI